MKPKPKRFEAIEALMGHPPSCSRSSITEEEIDTKLASMISDWEAQEYARSRENDYPSTGDQLDYIFHNGVAKWKTDMIAPVKAKYPKPS